MPNFVHDSLFKFYMQDIEFAKEFIKTYFSYDETSIMLLDTLKLEPVEMIAKNLRKSFVDILYSVLSICHKYKIYILIEHQSSPDSLMQARLYEYMASILRKHKRNNKDCQAFVMSMIVYAGSKPYNIDVHPFMSRPTRITDLGKISCVNLLENRKIALMLLALKLRSEGKISEFIKITLILKRLISIH